MSYSNLFVCLMGMGTVFFGLVCLVALTYLVGWMGQKTVRKSTAAAAQPAAAGETREDRERVAAAVSAALAEELGTDITGIRIISMKKV